MFKAKYTNQDMKFDENLQSPLSLNIKWVPSYQEKRNILTVALGT